MSDHLLARRVATMVRNARAKRSRVPYSELSTVYRELWEAWRTHQRDGAGDSPTASLRLANTILSVFAEKARREWVQRLLFDMAQRGLRPDLATLTAVLPSAESAGEALRIKSMARRQGFALDATFYNAVLRAVSHDRAQPLAERDAAVAGVWREVLGDSSIEPSALLFNTRLASAAAVDEAVLLIEQLNARGLPATAATYSAAVSGLPSVAAVEAILRYAEGRGDRKLLRDPVLFTTCLNNVAKPAWQPAPTPVADAFRFLTIAAELQVPATLEMLCSCLRLSVARLSSAAASRCPVSRAELNETGQLVESTVRAAFLHGADSISSFWTSAMQYYNLSADLPGANRLINHFKSTRVRPSDAMLRYYSGIPGSDKHLDMSSWANLRYSLT
ncbi:hypothetical protein DIPPA_19188 [Diplonema papillatum]|nr:hypothetical protein DIPPA_19188 [Diplonema papillatum]